jgi:2-oxoglutarate ferredoxin oxidoreductase subunit alpha
MHDLTLQAFALADAYRMPVMLLADGRLGQMMEPLTLHEGPAPAVPDKPWALTGAEGRKPNMIRSLLLGDGELEAHNVHLQDKYTRIRETEVRVEERCTDDCDLLLVAYGTSARIAKAALRAARQEGLRAGLLRPLTLWPFPAGRLRDMAAGLRGVLVVEMSSGQMLEDVALALNAAAPLFFVGRMGGGIPSESDILEKLRCIHQQQCAPDFPRKGA